MMDESATPAGRRRVRYALLAVIVALTTVGATAIVRGVLHDPTPSAAVPLVVTPAPESAPAVPSGAAGAARPPGPLTSGPLLPSSPPVRVVLPTLRASAGVIGLGRQRDGSMQVPDDATTVGWYTGAPTPGALGPAILAGHVDYRGKPGTFARLAELKVGNPIDVVRADDTMAMFTVTKVERYPKNRFPSAAVYGAVDHAGLRLITCGGDFDDAAGHYRDNIVVYATLVRSHRL